MTNSTFRYETPTAFRAALKERFSQIARADRRYRLDELQRQFAYDRALPGCSSPGTPTSGCSRAREPIDLGDHFTLDITRVSALQEEAKGARVHVRAQLGPTSFASFHIDVVVGTAMTGTPDIVAPLTPLAIEGLVRPHYRVFPIEDHLSDKLCATVGNYLRDGAPARSSRVKDLVDIVIISTTQTIDAVTLRTAVVSNAARRKMQLPERFSVADPVGWAARYPRVAAEAPGVVPGYDATVCLGAQLFDPVLTGTAAGTWNPATRAWILRPAGPPA